MNSHVLRSPVDLDSFINSLLDSNFEGTFGRRPPYRLMFESESALVYVQNFNKESDHLWYRVTENPWTELRRSTKPAWVAFTNPPEHLGFVIPVSDIKDRCQQRGWTRPHLEVNIDPATCRWTELDWDIKNYRKIVGS